MVSAVRAIWRDASLILVPMLNLSFKFVREYCTGLYRGEKSAMCSGCNSFQGCWHVYTRNWPVWYGVLSAVVSVVRAIGKDTSSIVVGLILDAYNKIHRCLIWVLQESNLRLSVYLGLHYHCTKDPISNLQIPRIYKSATLERIITETHSRFLRLYTGPYDTLSRIWTTCSMYGTRSREATRYIGV